MKLILFALLVSQASHGLLLEGKAAEQFLRTARLVERVPIGRGITKPEKCTLTDGKRQLHAIFKTVDEMRPEVMRGEAGFLLGFRDSYKFEIAAYELDKLLGLNMVPPTVEREIEGRTGSLQMWVEGAVTEEGRQEHGLLPPDGSAWSKQISKLMLFDQLIFNEDDNNVGNVLYDPDFRVYAIDHSRSFRRYPTLPRSEELIRFPREFVDRLAALDEKLLAEKLGRWVTEPELKALMKRRDLLLERVRDLIDSRGRSRVLF